MARYPEVCKRCGNENSSDLSYCTICGARFGLPVQNRASVGKKLDRRKISKEQKLKLKKVKKKRELTELYKNKKITSEQYINGLRKLGYGADVEKAMAFKKYIQDQIEAFEKMDAAPEGMEGQYHFDPNESKADLPRDEFGNPICDFSVRPTQAKATRESSVPTMSEQVQRSPDMNNEADGSDGPVFGESLFSTSSTKRTSADTERKRGVPKGRLVKEMERPRKRRKTGRTLASDLEWDEDEEEVEPDLEEDEFVIELDEEEFEGESGWWDDDEWELDWSEEDEEEWEDWEMDLEEDEWEAVWDDEEEEEDNIYDEEEKEFVLEMDEDDEEEEESWDDD
ncbi:MAG: hypothetical protein R6V01_06455 [Thermoplasmatota archaeon]